MLEQRKIVSDLIQTPEQEAELRLREGGENEVISYQALEDLNRFHDEHGCFSDVFRTF